ncbi:MAG: DNA translocase FtsK [Treponema sp.]|nr:DNA translocase FtsK [Treponema sp.]
MFGFTIPLYLFCAAWLLADPAFRPGRIFILAAAIIPFITLALGFSLIRDFETRRESWLFIDSLGRPGLGILVTTAAVLECAGIVILHSVFFGGGPAGVKTTPVILPDPAFDHDLPPDETAAETSGGLFRETCFPDGQSELPGWEPPISPAMIRELEGFCPERAEKDDILVLDDSVFNPYSRIYAAEPVSSNEVFPVKEKLGMAVPETPAFAAAADAGSFWKLKETVPFDEEREEAKDFLKPPEEIQEGPEYEIPEIERTAPDSEETLLDLDRMGQSSGEFSGTAEIFPERLEPAASGAVKKKVKKYRGSYSVPVEGILNQYPDGQYWIIDETTQQAARILQETLKEFNIEAEVTGIRKGPVITMFEILPAPGVKLSKIVNLQDNIALRLAASSVRIVAPIPGKHAVGIEVPNKKRNIVSFREIIEGELRRDSKRPEIPVVLGKDITGEAATIDLVQMPHLLIAGSTGSGKSVCVNSMILSILYQRSPADCRLILIDPKIVELKLYNDIPHLLTPVITEPKRAFQALQYCIYEMERRYACLDSMGVRDIKSYNRRIRERSIAAEHMPYIVVVIDEFADLMATTGKELESTVARLAAMSRAVGIHLVLATQRPSIDVITGLIKANIPSRIAFMVASKMDSRIIIDMVGAEKLLGKGDMLYAGAVDPFPVRMQGAFISEEEVERVVDYVKSLGEPEYIDDEIFYDEEEDPGASLFSEGDDPLYDKALEVVYQQGKASASYIQRRLKIGYNRAARLVEEMEHRGVVGPAQGSRPRELLRSA